MDSLFLGLTIGAVVSGTFNTAFGTAQRSLGQLSRQTDQLTARQQRMGDIMARSVMRPHANLGRLHRQYERIGQAIERNRIAQNRLNDSISRHNRITALGTSARSSMMEEGVKLAVIGTGVKKTVEAAAKFHDQINDLAVTGQWSASEQMQIGAVVRASALQYNQTTTDINTGLGTLVAGGITAVAEMEAYTPKLTRIATAWRTSFEDIGNMTLALNNNLGIGADGFDRSMNMLGYAGKAGQFEASHMAKWLPSLTPFYQAMGIQGEEAVAEIGAALQVARMGAGTSDEAANNMRNFMAKLTAPDTLKDFDKAGIDLQGQMRSLINNGMTPMTAMLTTIQDYIGTKSPQAAADFTRAMAIKDDKERQMAVNRLNETYKLGELFQDQQALSFIRPMLANQQQFKDIRAGSMAAADKDVIGKDFNLRMTSPMEQFKSFKLVVSDLAITLGEAFMPALLDAAEAVRPMVIGFASWAKQNPKLVSGIVGLVAGLIGMKLAFFTIGWVVMSIISPFTKLAVVFARLRAGIAFLRGLAVMGRFAPMAMKLGRAIAFVGKMFNILRFVLIGNPIGLAVTLLVGAAILIYKNWTPIKAFFKNLWNRLKAFANSGVGNILRTLASFTPLGLFVRAWSAVFSYFAGLSPKFRQYGINIIQGLIGGVTAKFGALKAKMSEMASSVSGFFASKLGIRSPSRVFMGFGRNIAEGVAIGIGQQTPTAIKASDAMAKRLAQTEYSNKVLGSQSFGRGMASGTVQFSPTINVQVGAGAGDVAGQVQQGLNASYAEFERMLERVEANRERRRFA